jgi:hypothetical protein
MDRISGMFPDGEEDTDVHRGARRASQRYPLHADVELVEPLAATGVAINASTGGMRVAIDKALDVDALCVARIVTEAGAEIIEKARVVWTRELPDGWLVGLQFVADH